MNLIIALSKKLIDSIVGYGKEIISYFENAGIADIATAKPLVKVKEAFARMEQGYMKARKNAYTQQLFALDATRDNAYRIFRTVLQGSLYSEVPEEVTAAQRLNRVFEQYGAAFLELSYVKETAQMSKFIIDMKKPENAAAIAALKMEAKMTKLEEAEKKFEDTYSLSISDKAARDAYDSASAARREFELAIHRLMNYAELKAMDGDAKWIALCQKIEAFNTKFEQNEGKRTSSQKKDSKDSSNGGSRIRQNPSKDY